MGLGAARPSSELALARVLRPEDERNTERAAVLPTVCNQVDTNTSTFTFGEGGWQDAHGAARARE